VPFAKKCGETSDQLDKRSDLVSRRAQGKRGLIAREVLMRFISDGHCARDVSFRHFQTPLIGDHKRTARRMKLPDWMSCTTKNDCTAIKKMDIDIIQAAVIRGLY
jgi:hypothetical protein